MIHYLSRFFCIQSTRFLATFAKSILTYLAIDRETFHRHIQKNFSIIFVKMAASISQLTPQRLDVPSCTGKRTRSNSTSSSTSSVTSSAGASSIFSNSHSGSFADNLSSYSSPSSEQTSPSSSGSISDDERPCKSLRTNLSSVGPVSSGCAEEDVVATLTNLEQKCTLSAPSSSIGQSDSKDISPSPPVSGTNSGKSLFVDCLVGKYFAPLSTIPE